jgi:hypothetical protein
MANVDFYLRIDGIDGESSSLDARSFFAYEASFRGGISVAAADLDMPKMHLHLFDTFDLM